MRYSELNLKINQNYNIAKTQQDQKIHVLKYLPIEDKIDLIEITLQRAQENGFYNEMKLTMYFNLYLIYMYTDLEFTDEEKSDEFKLYNELESNEIVNDVIGALDEYEDMFEFLNVMKETRMKYKMSTSALLQTFIQDMPKNAETMSEIVDNFDKEKYKEVVEFAQYANGNRPLGQT